MGKEFSTTIQGAANKVSEFIIASFLMQCCDVTVFFILYDSKQKSI